MYHAVSPFHLRKINDSVLRTVLAESDNDPDTFQFRAWRDRLGDLAVETSIISLYRNEVEALKVYDSYWSIYKNHIIDKYEEIQNDLSIIDKLPSRLLSVIEMHFKSIQTPSEDASKWGERFNYSLIDGMKKYIDSIQSVLQKWNDSLSSIKSDSTNESVFIVPRLSIGKKLPIDSIYESMNVFFHLDRTPESLREHGILECAHDAIWKSLSLKPGTNGSFETSLDLIDVLCRSGITIKEFNLSLLNQPDSEPDHHENKEEHTPLTPNETLSIVLQIYRIPNGTGSILDCFLEFRMFLNRGMVTGITQIQTLLNIMNQDHLKESSTSFLIPLREETVRDWNGVLSDDMDTHQRFSHNESNFDILQRKLKKLLMKHYDKHQGILQLDEFTHCCIDFVIIRDVGEGYHVRISNIGKIPEYQHEYGMYQWHRDREQILNGINTDWKVLLAPMRKPMDFDTINAVLCANVYSCAMDYFVNRKWIQKPRPECSSCCTVL